MLRKMFRKEGPVFDATNLRNAWAEACHALGLGMREGWRYHGLQIHDLRRGAVRNLVRAGASEASLRSEAVQPARVENLSLWAVCPHSDQPTFRDLANEQPVPHRARITTARLFQNRD
jgi:hypothetical protein